MGIEFNTQDMLDAYLFENTQLLEALQEIIKALPVKLGDVRYR